MINKLAILVVITIVPIIHGLLSYQSNHKWRSVYERIQNDPNFSNFRQMIQNTSQIVANLHFHDVTVFAPENSAFAYDRDNKPEVGGFSEEQIKYHVSFDVKTLESLNFTDFVESVDGHNNPPLWITKKSWATYVNNAKILDEIHENPVKNQVLLKIDEILDPKVRSPVKNASAFDFLQNYYKWKISDHKVGIFADKVKHCHICTKLFKNPGRNTYFVPIDANLDYAKTHDLDRYIIEGHVVPNHVLFTRPAEKNSIFETHANSNFVYIVIVLSKDPHTRKLLVKSSTVLGSDSHRKGDVLSEILVENIPVTNGVVHLISQPLGIFKKALTVFPYLPTKYKIESDPDLSISWEFAKRSQLHKFFDYNDTRKFTYFVPNNHAWRRLFQIYGSDPFDSHSDRSNRKVGEILGRHLIASMRRWYTIEDLVKSSENFNNHTIISSTSGQIPLKFFRDYYGYHILWNGKQVNVIRPNYECADGIVHILDGVLVDLVEFEKFEDEDESKGGFWAVLKDFVSN